MNHRAGKHRSENRRAGDDRAAHRRRGTRRHWVRLDNASNIFLAARTDTDTKVFRLGAELDHEIDPGFLQAALDATYDRYPLYHAVLRRGVFWYYLQESDLRPQVAAEEQPTCAQIYHPDRRELLFRVLHHRRRITLEVFHALSDGTGALWFLTDLVTAYLRLQYPDDVEDDPGAPERIGPGGRGSAVVGPVHELTGDSFQHHFRRRPAPAFPEVAEPAPLAAAGGDDHTRDDAPPTVPPRLIGRVRRPPGQRVHRVTGHRTPDARIRAVELSMPAADVLALARAEGVSLTIYLTALFCEAVRTTSGGLGDARTLAVSVPVNLRQFFPSTSPRNFFATVRIEHTFGEGEDDLGSICRNLTAQFKPQVSPKALEAKLRKLVGFERTPMLRILPRPAKDLVLGLANRISNRGLTLMISNLGRVRLPEPLEHRVERMTFQISAARPQFCAISHAGVLVVTFTSPFVETDHVRAFTRMLTEQGVDVTVAATRVTEEELGEDPP